MSLEKIRIPNSIKTLSHFRGLLKMFKGKIGKNEYTILYSEIDGYIHIRVHRKDKRPICEFMDMQEIKNLLLGEDKVAIQVFPKEKDFVDKGNTYHLFSWEGIEVPNLKKLYKYEE